MVILGDTPYWVKRYEKEGRFGLDDEPKYWVRRAIDLTDGSTKILKLVFHEEFDIKIGEIKVKCFRSPPPIIKKARSLMGVLSLFDITYVVISLLSTDPFKGHFSLPGGGCDKAGSMSHL